jgi:hypothetical protein
VEQRLFFMTKVFPRMCNVRTVDQVLGALAHQPEVAGTGAEAR